MADGGFQFCEVIAVQRRGVKALCLKILQFGAQNHHAVGIHAGISVGGKTVFGHAEGVVGPCVAAVLKPEQLACVHARPNLEIRPKQSPADAGAGADIARQQPFPLLCAFGAEHFPTLRLVPMCAIDRAVVVGRQVVFDLLEYQLPVNLRFGGGVVNCQRRRSSDGGDVGSVGDTNALHLIGRV